MVRSFNSAATPAVQANKWGDLLRRLAAQIEAPPLAHPGQALDGASAASDLPSDTDWVHICSRSAWLIHYAGFDRAKARTCALLEWLVSRRSAGYRPGNFQAQATTGAAVGNDPQNQQRSKAACEAVFRRFYPLAMPPRIRPRAGGRSGGAGWREFAGGPPARLQRTATPQMAQRTRMAQMQEVQQKQASSQERSESKPAARGRAERQPAQLPRIAGGKSIEGGHGQ